LTFLKNSATVRTENEKEKMKYNTVNVIEVLDKNIESIRSFSDDKNGNQEAEKLFRQIIKDNQDEGLTEADVESYIEDEYYSSGNGHDTTYELYLIHSIRTE
jgi:LPS O-antigen subunit length determinant protein (WzzB/FepE family)